MNRSGIIQLPGLGLNVSTSRGMFDAGALSENFRKLNAVGALNEYRVVAALDPTVFCAVDDQWYHLPMPNPVLAALGVAIPAFEDNIRFTNMWRVICARLRALHAGGGAAGAELSFQFRKGGAAAVVADEVLLNPVVFDETTVTVQNASGFPKEEPNSMKVFGADKDPLSLWVKRNALWVTVAAVDIEIMVSAQMLAELPPAMIIEP